MSAPWAGGLRPAGGSAARPFEGGLGPRFAGAGLPGEEVGLPGEGENRLEGKGGTQLLGMATRPEVLFVAGRGAGSWR